MAALMRGRSWSTRNPAPRLRCPTSLLPICPAGRPTASPDASSRLCGHSASRRFQFHIGAASSALRAGSSFSPNPSSTTRTTVTRRTRADAARDDRRERVRLQRGAADERAVDVRLGEELGGVRVGHAAAVLDRDLVGGRRVELAEDGRGSGPRPPGRRRRWRRRRCRSPRPARRRSPGRCPASRSSPASAARTWRSMTVSVWPARRSSARSPTAAIGRRPWATALATLRPTPLIGLAVVLAALRVAEDHVRRAIAGEHQRARLAGERAALLAVHRLRTDERPPGDGTRDVAQPDRRRADHRGDAAVTRPRRPRPPRRGRSPRRAVGGFIFQLPATTGRRISRSSGLASSTSRRRR